MAKSKEELELELRGDGTASNFPGYKAKLEYRPLKASDASLLAPVFRSSAKSIRTYLSSYQFADRWWLKDTQAFVMACVNDDFPSLHYLYLIGGQPVALGSLHSYGGSLRDVQVVLAVFGEHQGKGIGYSVAASLKQLAFEVWGFSSLWWIVDVTNRSSIKVAEKIGCVWDSSFEENGGVTELGSGLWHRFVHYRGSDLADGVLQGADIEYWSVPKSQGMLKMVIKSRQNNTRHTESE